MNSDYLKTAFSMSETPIKMMAYTYFEQFMADNIDTFVVKNNIDVDKIPKKYKTLGNELQIKKDIGPIWNNKGLLSINGQPGEFDVQLDEDKWIIFWDVVSADHEWDEFKLKVFGDQETPIKEKMIGGMFTMCRYVFESMCNIYPVLSNFELKTDPTNLTMYIHDKTLDIEHFERIGIKIERLNRVDL